MSRNVETRSGKLKVRLQSDDAGVPVRADRVHRVDVYQVPTYLPKYGVSGSVATCYLSLTVVVPCIMHRAVGHLSVLSRAGLFMSSWLQFEQQKQRSHLDQPVCFIHSPVHK